MNEAFEIALRTEEEGFQLYTQAQKKSAHPLGKDILAFLAGEELKHKAFIKQMMIKLNAGGKFDQAELPSNARYGATIFSEALKNPGSRVKAQDDDIGVLKTGVEFEIKGSTYFANAAKETSNEEERKFFELMSREERAHKQLLLSSIEYLENPESWFEKGEQILLDGA